MIAVVIGGRRSIRALADYVLHDQATAAAPRPVTSERVEWTACLGVPMTDPQLMVRCMQGLAADAAILKSLAGVLCRSLRGRARRRRVVGDLAVHGSRRRIGRRKSPRGVGSGAVRWLAAPCGGWRCRLGGPGRAAVGRGQPRRSRSCFCHSRARSCCRCHVSVARRD